MGGVISVFSKPLLSVNENFTDHDRFILTFVAYAAEH